MNRSLPRPLQKKRNAYKLANEDLQAQVDFFKTMFLYGAGIPETDLLAYRMRVEKMRTIPQAGVGCDDWEEECGKRCPQSVQWFCCRNKNQLF